MTNDVEEIIEALDACDFLVRQIASETQSYSFIRVYEIFDFGKSKGYFAIGKDDSYMSFGKIYAGDTTFEKVFNSCSIELQAKMLFYLDIFRRAK